MPIPKPYAKDPFCKCVEETNCDWGIYEPCDECPVEKTQGIDVEQEIMNILAQEITAEIDMGMLNDLRPSRIRKNYE